MPIFSAPINNPLIHYYTNKKHAEDTEDDGRKFIRKECDDFVYAKKTIKIDPLTKLAPNNISGANFQFLIRLSADRKRVFDPREKHCISEDVPDYVTRTCKNTGDFIQVNYNVFNMYLLFLSTESDSFYKECNRLLRL